MKNLFLGLLFVAALLAAGCKSVGDAADVGEKFYSARKSGDYATVKELLDSKALEASPWETWEGFFKMTTNDFGPLVSYKKQSNFETNTVDGETLTKLTYDVKYEKATFEEIITFVDLGDGVKIRHLKYEKQ